MAVKGGWPSWLRRAGFGLIGAGLLLFGISAAGLMYLRSDRFSGDLRAIIAARASELLGLPVTIDVLTLEPVAGRFTLTGFDARAEGASASLIRVETVRGEVGLGALLKGHAVVKSLEIDGVAIDLSRRDGHWSWTPPPVKGGSIEIAIGSLSVTRGTARVADSDIPFTASLAAVSLDASGVLGERLAGHIEAREGTFATPSLGTTPVSVAATFVLTPETLEVTNLRAGSDWVSAGGDALVDLKEAFSGRVRVTGDLHLAPLTVLRGDDAARGEVHFESEVKHASSGWTVAGSLDGRNLGWHEWNASLLSGPFTWDGAAGLRGGPFEATTGGGTAKATFEIPGPLRGPGRAHVSVSAERLSQLLASLRRDLPLEAAVEGEADLSWAKLAAHSLGGHGAVRLTALRGKAGSFPVEGTGRFSLSNGVIGLDGINARSGVTALTGRGSFDPFAKTWHLEVAADSDDFTGTVPLVEACARAFHIDPEPWELDTLAGHGSVHAAVDESGGSWTSAGTLAGESAAFRGGRWGAVAANYSFGEQGLAFTDLTVARDGMRGWLEARFDRRGGGFRLDGRVESLEAGDALAAAGLTLDLEGLLTGSFEVERAAGHLAGRFDALSGAGSYLGLPFDHAEAHSSFTETLVRFEKLEAFTGDGRVTLEGTLAPQKGIGSASLTAESVELSGLGISGEIAGVVSGEATLASSEGRITLKGDMRGAGIRTAGLLLGSVLGTIETDLEVARFDLRVDALAGRIAGRLDLGAPRTIDAQLTLEGASISRLLEAAGAPASEDLSGTVSAAIAIRGPLDRQEELILEGTVSSMELQAGTTLIHLVEEVPLKYVDGRATFSQARFEGQGSHVVLGGSITTDSPPRFDLTATGDVDLGVIRIFVPDVLARGTMRLALRATGTRADLTLGGTATVSGGRLRRFDIPTAIENIDADLRLDGGKLFVEKLAAELGGGTIRGSGSVRLHEGPAGAGEPAGAIEGTLRAASVTLAMPAGFRGTWNGLLRLGGTIERPQVTGDLDLSQGVYTRNFGIESMSLFGRGREFGDDVPGIADLRDRITLDLTVKASDSLWLRNDLGSMECRAALKVTGSLSRPLVAGRITGFEGGRVSFRRTDYQTRDVTVDFAGPRIDNPYINATAETRVAGYDVVLSVRGELQHLDVSFTSVPSLPENQIISLLVTGSTDSLEGDPSGSSNGLARSYLGGAVTGFIEQPIEEFLSLDTFRITPMTMSGSSDPTTRLTVGKRLGGRLYVHYSRDLTGAEAPIYGVEYQFGRKVRGFLESGAHGGVGGDIRYTTRFRARQRRGGKPEEVPSPDPRPPIASVRIEGVSPALAADLAGKAGIEAGDPFSRSSQVRGRSALKHELLDRGYLEAQVRSSSSETSAGIEVLYTVSRGRRIIVRLEGLPRGLRRETRARLKDLWEEALFTEDLLDAAAEEITETLRSRGHYSAFVERRTGTDADGNLEVVFHADPGPLVTVESVTLTGQQELDEERILRQVLTRPDRKIKRDYLLPEVLEADRATIVRLYRSLGFLDATVAAQVSLSPDGAKARVEIVIDEGSRALVGEVSVRVNGEPVDPEGPGGVGELVPDLRTGQPYNPAFARSTEYSLQSRWDSLGYPDVRVETESRRAGEGVDVTWNVTTGEAQTVHGIEVEGNELTREGLIRRQVEIQPGDPLSKEAMRATEQRLYRLGVFESVDVDPVPFLKGDTGERIVRVRVHDADNFSITGGVGYDTEDGPRVTVGFGDSNVRGAGRSLVLQTRVSQVDQRAQLTFIDRHFLDRPLNLLLPVFWEYQDQQSFQFNRTGVSAQVGKELAPKTQGLLRYNFSIADVSNLAKPILDAAEGPLQPGRTRLGSVGYAVIWDARDSPFTPTRGVLLNGDLRVFSPYLGSDADADQVSRPNDLRYAPSFTKFYAQETWQKPLGRGVVFAQSTRLGLAKPYGTTAGIPLVERYFAGGDTTVRGFPRDLLGSPGVINKNGIVEGGTIVDGEPVGGEALLIFNQEIRFPIHGALGGEVFFDAGNTYLLVKDLSVSDMRPVLGAGLRLETPVGPIRIEYGRKLDRKPGEGLGQFFISIGPAF